MAGHFKRKGRKLKGLSKQEARARAVKAWQTKHGRYKYGARHHAASASDDESIADFKQRAKEQQEQREGEGFIPRMGTYGVHLSEEEQVKRTKEDEGFKTFSDILNDPEIQAALKGASDSEKLQFQQNIAAFALSEQRAAQEAKTYVTEGGEEIQGNMLRGHRETRIVGGANALARMRPSRKMSAGDEYEIIRLEVEHALGPLRRDPDTSTLTKAILAHRDVSKQKAAVEAQIAKAKRENADFKIKAQLAKQKQALDLKQRDADAVLTRVAGRIGGDIQQREEERSARVSAAKFSQQMRDLEVRQQQGIWKFNRFHGVTHEILDRRDTLPTDPVEREASIRQKLETVIFQVQDPYAKTGGSNDPDTRSEEEIRAHETQIRPELQSLAIPVELRERTVKSKAQERREQKYRERGPSRGDYLRGKPIQTQIDNLAKDLAKSTAEPGSKEYIALKERIDSLRIKTALAWDPSLLHDTSMENLFNQYSTVPRKAQRTVQKAEDAYKTSGHEDFPGLSPKGFKAQLGFVTSQKKRQLKSLRIGDMYAGYDSKGNFVGPHEAMYGVTANKHWRYKSYRAGKQIDDEVQIYKDETTGRVVKRPVTMPGTGTTFYKDVPFGDTKTDMKNEIGHELTRTFEQPFNITIGARKVKTGYEKPTPYGFKDDLIVPLHSLKKEQNRTIDRYVIKEPLTPRLKGYNPDPKPTIEKQRIRYMPYSQLELEKGQHDQFSATIPEKTLKFRDHQLTLGERRLFVNADNIDNVRLYNASQFALGPSRARRERKLRETQELASRLRNSQEYTPDNSTKAFATDITQTRQQARIHEIMADHYIATGDDEVAQHHKEKANLLKELGAVGATTFGIKTRKRAKKVWLPETSNRAVKALAEKSPRFKEFVENKSLITDINKGAIEPLSAQLIDTKFKLRHPLSSPTGSAMGIEYGSIHYRERFIHPELRRARQLKQERLKLEKLDRLSTLFDEANGSDAPIHKKLLANQRSNLQRWDEYKAFNDATQRSETLTRLREQTLSANRAGVKTGKGRIADFRARRANTALRKEAKDLAWSLNRLEDKSPPLPTLRKHDSPFNFGGVSPHHELLSPAEAQAIRNMAIGAGGRMSKRNRNLLIGGAVVGTAAGAGYLYYRHKQKKKDEQERIALYNRLIPGPVRVPTPYIRSISKTRIGAHPITDELRLTGRNFTTKYAAGIKPKTLWKGSPADRGYSPNAKIGIPRPTRTFTQGRTTGKVFIEPNYSLNRIERRGTHKLSIRGRELPLEISIGKAKVQKLERKNPTALTSKDREAIAATYGLMHWEKQATPDNLRKHEELARIREFYSSGVPDERLLHMLDDTEAVERAKKKHGKKLRPERPEYRKYPDGSPSPYSRKTRADKLQEKFQVGLHH